MESPSLSVRATTESDNEAGNDQSNNQRNWSRDPSINGLRRDTSVNGLLLIKQRKNSDSPKYRTPNKLKEIMTIRMAPM